MKNILSFERILIKKILLFLGVGFILYPMVIFAADVLIDTAPHTAPTIYQKSGKVSVCTSATDCFAFFIDQNQDILYEKSTDGGASWGDTPTVLYAGTWIGIAIWYDKWTPGDTGNYVHIGYFANDDDLRYGRFDTTDNSSSSEVVIASAGVQGALTVASDIAMSKGTDGDLYVATVDATAPSAPASFVHKCPVSSDCTDGANWVSAGSNPWDGAGDDTDAEHDMIILPLPDDATHDAGDMMLVSLDVTDGTVEYKVYDDSGDSWSTNFTDLPQGATDSTTYYHTLSGTVDLTTGDLYISFVHNAGTANTSEVRANKYSGGAWSNLTDPWPDTTDGTSAIVDSSIGIDGTNGDLYVVYNRGTSATSNDIYYSHSVDGGTTWSIDNLLSDDTNRDHRAVSIDNYNVNRLFAVWYDGTNSSIRGNTVIFYEAAAITRKIRLFAGAKIKIINGKVILQRR